MQQMTVTIVMVPIMIVIGNTVRQVDMVVMAVVQCFPHDHIYDTPTISVH